MNQETYKRFVTILNDLSQLASDVQATLPIAYGKGSSIHSKRAGTRNLLERAKRTQAWRSKLLPAIESYRAAGMYHKDIAERLSVDGVKRYDGSPNWTAGNVSTLLNRYATQATPAIAEK